MEPAEPPRDRPPEVYVTASTRKAFVACTSAALTFVVCIIYLHSKEDSERGASEQPAELLGPWKRTYFRQGSVHRNVFVTPAEIAAAASGRRAAMEAEMAFGGGSKGEGQQLTVFSGTPAGVFSCRFHSR